MQRFICSERAPLRRTDCGFLSVDLDMANVQRVQGRVGTGVEGTGEWMLFHMREFSSGWLQQNISQCYYEPEEIADRSDGCRTRSFPFRHTANNMNKREETNKTATMIGTGPLAVVKRGLLTIVWLIIGYCLQPRIGWNSPKLINAGD